MLPSPLKEAVAEPTAVNNSNKIAMVCSDYFVTENMVYMGAVNNNNKIAMVCSDYFVMDNLVYMSAVNNSNNT